MITKITMNQVASYKSPATLATDKKVNLVYGLNGTGKSTLSNFLYDRNNPKFANCSTEGLVDENVLVYNRQFINDYFYEPDSLKGIFTLSKENKVAEEKVKNAEKEIAKLDIDRDAKISANEAFKSDLLKRKQEAEGKTWEIKTKYTGGDRVLEFCLERLKGQKDKLFDHISSLAKPAKEPEYTTEQLKKEAEALQGSTAQKYSVLPIIGSSFQSVETHSALQKVIIGNETSTVAELIKRLGNSDWVKEGLEYLPEEIQEEGELCPFCQTKTITKTVKENIQNYFDKTYEDDISALKELYDKYEQFITDLFQEEDYLSNPFLKEEENVFEKHLAAVRTILNQNKTKIADKIKTPSQKVVLDDSSNAVQTFNSFIENINKSITQHNAKIDNIDDSTADIKRRFWELMRWDYDQTISAYTKFSVDTKKKQSEIAGTIAEINEKMDLQRKVVAEHQKETINISEAIAKINNGLIELGIDSFHIVKHSENHYKIARDKESGETFHTLSEGERMIISFLYFVEMCNGKQSAAETNQNKVVVIDDPISSLSHIYVFNIGQLIKRHFTNPASKFQQVFVLTHCLYFFYELTLLNEEKRHEHQALFRITKNETGSQIQTMKYQEVQNDYQSYWHVIKDDKQSPALIANCMRNIMEYFFSFIEKLEFGSVFQKASLKADKYQAFYRFMNRESHSIGQNIFDIKEFDYQDFKDAFKLVFEESGYSEHYKRMMK